MNYLENIEIGFSPLTQRIYIGRVSKKNKNMWAGVKKDITNNFLQVLLYKFPIGEHEISINGKPKYKINIEEIIE